MKTSGGKRAVITLGRRRPTARGGEWPAPRKENGGTNALGLRLGGKKLKKKEANQYAHRDQPEGKHKLAH